MPPAANPQACGLILRNLSRVKPSVPLLTQRTQSLGRSIALDPETHDYVLGKTLRDVDAACRERFNSKPVYIFRIGGGGAVKVGGAKLCQLKI